MAGVSKVVYDGTVLIDLTSDTVVRDALAQGVTAHTKDGSVVTGVIEITTPGHDLPQQVAVTTCAVQNDTLVIALNDIDASSLNYQVNSIQNGQIIEVDVPS